MKRMVKLEKYEYLISANDKARIGYEVFYKGKKISDVTGIIRIDLLSLEKEIEKKRLKITEKMNLRG